MNILRFRCWLLLPLLWLWSESSPACVNDYVPNTKAIAASRSLAEELMKVELVEPWEARRDRLRKEVEAGGDYKVRNDLASALMHAGDPKSAIQILEEIEKTNPGLYQTASNLGTAFELAGENEKALEWIRKGIERNPHSHESSEWIHVKVLQAKIKMAGVKLAGGGHLPESGSILGLDFSEDLPLKLREPLPEGNTGDSLKLDQIEAGLKHQLRERLQFVKAPDLVVASLLFDLGNIIALKAGSLGKAQGIYEMADSYLESDDGISRAKVLITMRIRGAHQQNRYRSIFADPATLSAEIAIVAVIAIYVLLKMREFRKWTRARRNSNAASLS